MACPSSHPPHSATPRPASRGAVAVEFAVVLTVFLAFMTLVAEFYRITLYDQALARVTHRGALAAGRTPAECARAVQAAFADDTLASWLFDRDDSGEIGFVVGDGPPPDGSPAQEVRIDIAADDGSLADGVRFNSAFDCGTPGSLIQVSSTVSVRPRFGIGEIPRRHVSWAVNQL